MVQKFDFQPLDLQGAYRIKPFYATDNRGGLIKDYNVDTFRANGIDHDLKEVFYTISKRGVIRATGDRRAQSRSGDCTACTMTCAPASRWRPRSHQTAPFLIVHGCGSSVTR